jgi:hypothetical protein
MNSALNLKKSISKSIKLMGNVVNKQSVMKLIRLLELNRLCYFSYMPQRKLKDMLSVRI